MFGFFKKNKKIGVSEGGSTLYKYSDTDKAIGINDLSNGESNIDAITEHIEKHIGKIEFVYHEIISPLVHIDIHLVYPTPERNFYTLVTSGMSDKPMKVPTKEHKPWEYGELMLCLPSTWKFDEESLKNEDNYWPIRMLKFIARFPHEYNTWISYGHTIPNGNPPATFTDNVPFKGVLVDLPVTVANIDFPIIKLKDNKKINIYSLIPLYENEMDFKLKHGNDELIKLFDLHLLNELIDVNRKSVVS